MLNQQAYFIQNSGPSNQTAACSYKLWIKIQTYINISISNSIVQGIRIKKLFSTGTTLSWAPHDDVIKWKHFPRYWPFVQGIHRSPVNSPHKGQWRGALKFSLICAWINAWANNREAGDLRRYRDHYGVTVMLSNNHGARRSQACTNKHTHAYPADTWLNNNIIITSKLHRNLVLTLW